MLARSVPPSNSNSKRSGSRGEGANSATSALSKLTTRPNFLKERRSQITNELQHMDKSQGLAEDWNLVILVNQIWTRPKPLKFRQSPPNPERHRKSDSQSPRKADRGNRLEGQHPHKPDRGRPEGQGLKRHSFLHPRTNSS
uniref:Uncharacterized protein n=1 Tax=Quercus lobata TaxID=97700 RepID=A0A7N2RAG4_QUELO